MGKEAAAKDPGKSDEVVLLPEVEVGGYTVSPWTMKQVTRITRELAVIREIAKKDGIGLETFDEKWPELILGCTDIIHPMIAVTLGITVEEAEGLPGDAGTDILAVIVTQNRATIKKLWSLALAAITQQKIVPA